MNHTFRLAWPIKQPDAVLDYLINLPIPAGDAVTSAQASVSPSGELSITALTLPGPLQLVMWLAGGVPARVYLIKVEVVTAQHRTFEWLITLPMDAQLAPWPPTDPLSPGFGSLVVWP